MEFEIKPQAGWPISKMTWRLVSHLPFPLTPSKMIFARPRCAFVQSSIAVP